MLLSEIYSLLAYLRHDNIFVREVEWDLTYWKVSARFSSLHDQIFISPAYPSYINSLSSSASLLLYCVVICETFRWIESCFVRRVVSSHKWRSGRLLEELRSRDSVRDWLRHHINIVIDDPFFWIAIDERVLLW